MNFIYRIIARKINDWENHEFDSEYNDSLALKLYLFQFINSYSSLFYIAFIKKYAENECKGGDCSAKNGCEDDNCLAELEVQLGTIFIINMSMNLYELGKPYLMSRWRAYQERKNVQALRAKGEDVMLTESRFEVQRRLEDYETPLDDYMEIIIDYGYVVMFSSAFPIVPFLALIVNIFEIRVDAFKLCALSKRPYPAPANSIGEWGTIIKTISILGTLTNTGIIIFTTDIFDLGSAEEQWLYFMVIEHTLLIVKILLSRVFSEVPERVLKGRIWSKRMADEKIFGKVTDVDEQRQIKQLNFKGTITSPVVVDPEYIKASTMQIAK